MPKSATTVFPHSPCSRGRSKAAKASYDRRVRRMRGLPDLADPNVAPQDHPPPGAPCAHPGCLSHVSHPCEGCGRIGGFPADFPRELVDEYGELRSWCLSQASPISVSNLRRQADLSWNAACSFLEHLEALRLLGSTLRGGIRAWSASLPIDEARVRMLRGARQ